MTQRILTNANKPIEYPDGRGPAFSLRFTLVAADLRTVLPVVSDDGTVIGHVDVGVDDLVDGVFQVGLEVTDGTNPESYYLVDAWQAGPEPDQAYHYRFSASVPAGAGPLQWEDFYIPGNEITASEHSALIDHANNESRHIGGNQRAALDGASDPSGDNPYLTRSEAVSGSGHEIVDGDSGAVMPARSGLALFGATLIDNDVSGRTEVHGLKGDQGDTGPQGVPGADAEPPNFWHDGVGAPADDLGSPGDYYLDTTNGAVYEKTGSTVWSNIANIKGPIGLTGDDGPAGPAGAQGEQGVPGVPGVDGQDGIDGAAWYDASGAPPSVLGQDGDYYLDAANGDVYTKGGGAWSLHGNIKGAPGADGADGADGPTAISTDAGQVAEIGSDSLILVHTDAVAAAAPVQDNDSRLADKRQPVQGATIDGYVVPVDETVTPGMSYTLPVDGRYRRIILTTDLALDALVPAHGFVGGGIFELTQDNIGGHAVSFPTGWVFPNGNSGTLNSDPDGITELRMVASELRVPRVHMTPYQEEV